MTASAIIGGFSWLRWFALMAVPYYVLICLGGVALRVITGKFEERCAVQTSAAPAPPFSRREIKTLVILLIVSVLWLTDFIHGLSPAIPALLGAVLLVCPRIGVLGWKDFEPRLSWGLVLTVGASLSLAQAMISTGTVDWLGQQFILVFTGGPQKPFLVLASIIIAVAIVHIAITNLAACVAFMIPIILTIAHTAGLNPITASNLLAYESGYFGAMDVGRLGLTMLGLTIFVGLCVAVPYWSFLGLPLMVH